MRRKLLVTDVIALLVAAASVPVFTQNNPRDAQRLIAEMAVAPGMTVGEIGAGSGELTVLMAQHVGPAGKVLSTEISDQRLAEIRKAVDAASLRNVEVLQAAAESTNLAAGCCDAIFMRNVYHHFANPSAINRSLFAALKPGGRVAVIDFQPGNGKEADTPAGRGSDGTHGVFGETVAKELEAAGFTRVKVEGGGAGPQEIFVVMRKPS
jgi:predicted methyltransferase